MGTSLPLVHALWMSTGLSCDGDSVSMTSATSPSLEDLVKGIIPGMPSLVLHHPLLAYDNGAEFLQAWYDAEEGKLDPFVLVLEGSVPNEEVSGEGCWAALGTNPLTGEPVTTVEWLERLAPKAAAVVAVGTCATYGGVPAMRNNPTGAMGLPDYLGWNFRSRNDIPIICIPGCPSQPDNITETILYLTMMLAGQAPMIDLDDALRPRWLFDRTVHEGCNRAAFCEHGDYASSYGNDPRCLVKLGCKGPVVKCNVPTRGWIRGIGGCPNVGGICIGCTSPGFPDRFLPFMQMSSKVRASTTMARFTYGPILRLLRSQSVKLGSTAPYWRRPSDRLLSGYEPRWNLDDRPEKLVPTNYTVDGREARFYELSPTEWMRAEAGEDGFTLSWTTALNAVQWLESLQERVANEAEALGLVVLRENLDSRGDLTWRETRLLVEDPSLSPLLLRVDLGSTGLVWKAGFSGDEGPWQAAVTRPSFDYDLFKELMVTSSSPLVLQRVMELLDGARAVRNRD